MSARSQPCLATPVSRIQARSCMSSCCWMRAAFILNSTQVCNQLRFKAGQRDFLSSLATLHRERFRSLFQIP